MPKVGKNIYKRKDGRWEGRYVKAHVNGTARYGSVYAPTYREVKEKLDQIRISISQIPYSHESAGKVSEISKMWLMERSSELKESSIIKYEDIIRNYINPPLGDRDLSNITNKDLMQFVCDLRISGGVRGNGLSVSTVSEVVTIMNELRIYAIKRNLNVQFSTDCIRSKHDRNDIRVLTSAEENRLINYLEEKSDLTSVGILICLYTGIRLGELCALQWSDIDLKEKV